ncbi:MAG: cyclic lactone autoinducer peptide [Clostridia bacterium]|nr:cyclic lactone autoinducer peptide [Clostridia bacterium]
MLMGAGSLGAKSASIITWYQPRLPKALKK